MAALNHDTGPEPVNAAPPAAPAGPAATSAEPVRGSYLRLLATDGFLAFLVTQFLGAFNDNVSRWIVTLYAVDLALGQGSKFAGAIGAIFTIPTLLFSGTSGWLADVRSKRQVIIGVKLFEIASMTWGFVAIASGRLPLILSIPFFMGLHATFFSPAKYGIVPEMLPARDLSRANGLLEMTTFLAIILGTSVGGVLFQHWKDEPGRLNLVLVTVAVVGFVTSLGVPRVPAAAPGSRFRLNPFAGVVRGIRDLRKDPALWETALGTTYFWFLGAFLLTIIAPLGREVMGLSDARTSGLETFLAIGIGAGSLLAGWLSADKVELGLVPIGSFGMGVFALLLAFRHATFGQAAAALVGLGGAGGFFAVPLNALLQHRSARDEKGLILATANFLNAAGMVASFGLLIVFGAILHLAPPHSIVVMGVLTFAVTGSLLLRLPDFLVRFSVWVFTHTVYRIRVVGAARVPAEGPALLVCNHVSHVDGFIVAATQARFIRFMVWKPYYDHPRMHWLFALMQAIPTGGRSAGEARESVERARDALKAGELVCIFAEGSISRTGNLLPFKKGMERILEGLDVPVVPVHLDRLWGSIFSFKDGRFFAKWPRKLPYPVTVTFGDPLPAAATARATRQAVQELGARAIEERETRFDVLPYRFLQTAKRRWFARAMADSGGRTLTFGGAAAAGRLLAGWLARTRPDEPRVGILLPASCGGALANLGVALAGRVAVNLNFTAGSAAVADATARTGLKTVLTSRRFLDQAKLAEPAGAVWLEDLLPSFGPLARAGAWLGTLLIPCRLLRAFGPLRRVRPDDPAAVIFSSGSTGTPKGVVLSHFNVLANLEAVEQVFWVTPQDRILGVLPFFHSFGYMGTIWFPLVSGFGAVYHPNPADARVIGELLARHRVTITISTPTFYGLYLRKADPDHWRGVRFAVAGAERLPAPLAAAFRERFGVELLEGYGMTEMAPVVAFNVPDFGEGAGLQRGRKPGTVGQPLPGVAVRVVDPATGSPVPNGEEGLLLVTGPNRMLGYLDEPGRTAAALRDGWYVTGDIGAVDEDGFIRLTDRLARFAKIAGEMVPFGRLEEAAAAVLGETPCAVTAVADPGRGERLVLFHTDPAATAAALREGLRAAGVPNLWIPKADDIRRLPALPLLGTGKLDLKALRELARDRGPDAAGDA